MTYTECADCGQRIPWGEVRVKEEIWKGGVLFSATWWCKECANK